MQKPIILPYVPRAQFEPFHARWQRWVCMITHRRCGKIYAVLEDMLHKAMLKKDGRYAYIAPLRNRAKVVAWEMLKSFARPIQTKPPNEAERYIQIHGGSRITLFGADNPDALRGQAFDGVVLDEYGDMTP